MNIYWMTYVNIEINVPHDSLKPIILTEVSKYKMDDYKQAENGKTLWLILSTYWWHFAFNVF